MHLPLAHLSGFEEGEDEELQAQLQAHSGGSGHEDEEGSQSHSQGSKEGSGGSAGPGGGGDGTAKPPKDLPCPRCQSMNTKFCYYNNYSVNQPRHFCRNCQRYWTVGGTLRNVPVGGGSRKKSRTRSRSDPYYRPPAPSASDDSEHVGMAGAMAGEIHPEFEAGAFGDFPLHPAAFLQLAAGLGMGDPFQAPAFGMAQEEEAELQAFYEATQGGFLSSAAAMMSAGLFLPELEPAHLALMHKATLWAEAQRLQTMARRQAWAAAEEQRECKPSVAGPNPAMAASRHQRRPGFWETALMHSRPSSKAAPLATRLPPPPPGSTSTSTPPPPATPGTPWGDAETKPLVAQEDAAAAYSSLVDEQTTSWGSGPDMYY